MNSPSRIGIAHLLPSLLASALALSGCSLFLPGLAGDDLLLREFPPEVLPVPVNDGVPPEIFDHQAVDINESGLIIGYTNSSGAYTTDGDRYAEFPARGFAISADGTGYTDLSADVAHSFASWPLDVSDAGKIVGAYLVSSGGSEYELHAYSIGANGSAFASLHPDGVESTKATHVNEDGRVFGVVMTGFKQSAVEFASDGSSVTELAPGYFYSRVQAACEEWVVISANLDENTESTLFLYSLDDSSLTALSIPGIDAENAEVLAIRNDGRMVGWYLELDTIDEADPEFLGDVGFTYTIGDAAAARYQPVNTDGEWEFIEYRFYDFTDDGTIVGIGFRLGPESLLPQARAVRLSWEFTGFLDITPPNGATYAEAYAINEARQVTGYAGFSFRDFIGRYTTTKNRGYVVTIE